MRKLALEDLESDYQDSDASSHIRPSNDRQEVVKRMLEKRVSERQAKIRQQVEDAKKERKHLDSPQKSVLGKHRGSSGKRVEVSCGTPGSGKCSGKARAKREDASYDLAMQKSKKLREPNVFDRLTADTKKKLNSSKESSVIRANAALLNKPGNELRIEERLLKYKKEHQNWVARQRLLKNSKGLTPSFSNFQLNTKHKRMQVIKEKDLKPTSSEATLNFVSFNA